MQKVDSVEYTQYTRILLSIDFAGANKKCGKQTVVESIKVWNLTGFTVYIDCNYKFNNRFNAGLCGNGRSQLLNSGEAF